eukprot:10994562-Ditylum_brightwellii.AAC.1
MAKLKSQTHRLGHLATTAQKWDFFHFNTATTTVPMDGLSSRQIQMALRSNYGAVIWITL